MKTIKLSTFILLFILYSFSSHTSRIISLAPTLTEILRELELESQLVGITRYCPKTPNASLVGGLLDPHLQSILRLKPDMVFLLKTPQSQQLTPWLSQNRIQFYMYEINSLSDLKQSFFKTAQIFKKPLLAKKKWNALEQQLKTYQQAKKHTALGIISTAPLIVAGPSTYAAEILEHLGYTSPLSPKSPPWVTLSLEQLLKLQVDYLILLGGQAPSAFMQQYAKSKWIIPQKPILQRPSFSLIEDIQFLQDALSKE